MLLALLAAAALAGCQADPAACDLGGPRLVQAHGQFLFGPTPLPLGEEDLGYFAYVVPQDEPLMMFDRHSVYVRQRIWDVEDNRRPGHSYQRRRTYSDEIHFSYR